MNKTLRELLYTLGAQLDPCGRIGFYDDAKILDKELILAKDHGKYVVESVESDKTLTLYINNKPW